MNIYLEQVAEQVLELSYQYPLTPILDRACENAIEAYCQSHSLPSSLVFQAIEDLIGDHD